MRSISDKNHPSQLSNLREGYRATWIGGGVNILLVIFKVSAGTLGNSQALVADGIHSLSDLFTDFIVLLGLKWGRKHEDVDHPYGHARIETISSMLVGLLLIIVGIGIFYKAVFSIYGHEANQPSFFAIWVALLSILLKEGLFWYTHAIGKRLGSLALIANAWHHRTDAMSSVAVLAGILATYYNPDWYLADSFAALLVTFFIAKVGINLVWGTLKELSDTAPDQEILLQLSAIVESVEGVRQVHDMRARYSGSQIFVEVHVVVDPDLRVREGHNIARTVKHCLLDEFPDVTRVITHIDPDLKE